jgi:hypothetical protein
MVTPDGKNRTFDDIAAARGASLEDELRRPVARAAAS